MRSTKIAALFILCFALPPAGAGATTLADCAGIVRVFGDASSWMSSCFVIGDGSWVITTSDAVTERAGPRAEQTIRYPVFISPYTGQAYQCELRASDKDLNLALLKLPIVGLPAAPLAKYDEFKKAAYVTTGQMMSGEPVGNSWPTEIYGVAREKSGAGYKLAVAQWNASLAFVTDMDKYKWLFLREVSPATPIPNGAMVARGSSVVGMYLNKVTLTGGKEDIVFGRCAMSSEIVRYLGDRRLDTAALYEPPKPTVAREEGAEAAFQLQAQIYSLVASGRAALALEPAQALVTLRPKDGQAQMVLGIALTASDKFEDALKAFDEAGKLDPKLPTLRANRALALVGLKRTAEAEQELLKAAEEAPMDVRPITALAEFYLADDKTLDKAFTYATKAAAMATNSPAAKLLLGRVEKRRKNYQNSINAIGEALKMAPEWFEGWFALGATYEEAGDKANAEKAYRMLAEKHPKNPDALLTLASFFVDEGKKEEALTYIGKVRDLKPPKEVLDAAQALEDKVLGKKSADS